MAYSDFTLESAVQKFSLNMIDPIDLHEALEPVAISPALEALLNVQIPIATAIHTEKARSELIVVPIIMEARLRSERRTTFFSGIPFDVNPELGLNGVCDYLFSRSLNQFILGPPILVVVEAKNDSIRGGLGQCIAEMVAARIFNAKQAADLSVDEHTTIHGLVTTGSLWRFLKLKNDQLQIDPTEYTLESVGKILAILIDCLAGREFPPALKIEGDL